MQEGGGVRKGVKGVVVVLAIETAISQVVGGKLIIIDTIITLPLQEIILI